MENQQKTYLLLGCALFISMVYWSSPYETHHASITMDQRPSFVLILTDDQDVVLEGLRPMQHTKKLVAQQGLTLTNAFVASPLCCPSRSSILTGQYVHNHYAINNSLSGQCNGQRWRAIAAQLKCPRRGCRGTVTVTHTSLNFNTDMTFGCNSCSAILCDTSAPE
ncbi:hypothetical protein O3P69_018165 [Scylla paramamosain]|uniref:Sulfatase N-terminal domain-containing protein n=1 Tax=Scylla paramamosain TaxID=85552 RepID=A0AAW0TI36_SCYPA